MRAARHNAQDYDVGKWFMKLRFTFKLGNDRTFHLCRLVEYVPNSPICPYSHRFAVSLKPVLLEYWRGYWDYCVVVFGVRLRYTRRYGGMFV